MRIKITGRHMEITDAIQAYAEKKVARLGKFHNRLSDIEVIFESTKLEKRVEIILKVDHHAPFVAQTSHEDAYACLDAAVDKIERQVNKFKEKTHKHKGQVSTAVASADVLDVQEIADGETELIQ
ncbi:MAG: ribosome-associated translation inhibitor RaiA [Phycisphaerae bacterium]|nr:ribosome-associated translation inhibitor RaiA [Phycisphaerae bacterium]